MYIQYIHTCMFVCSITTIQAHTKTLRKRAMTRFILRLCRGSIKALFRRYCYY